MENNRNTAEDFFKSKGYKRFNSPDIYIWHKCSVYISKAIF